MSLGLIAGFFGTALLYASVGFGGGSTYTALLTLSGVDYRILPLVSLACNVIVVTGGTIRYARAGLIPWKRVLPLVIVSAPMAFLGGLTPIKQPVFMALLGGSLLVAGLLLLFQREREDGSQSLPANLVTEGVLGGMVGYLSGVVGIGGGIFLAPILHLMRWGQARSIAATASLFILVNSIAGIVGQAIKLGHNGQIAAITPYWPLAIAVLIGGQIGSHLGIRILSPALVRRATGILILYVSIQLLWKTLLA
jgi:uncharacterized protein